MSMSFMCNGNVPPSRFVKLDTSTIGGYVLVAGAGEKMIGISQPGVRQPPIVGLDDTYAGIQNVNTIEVATTNDETWVETGGAVTFGDQLKSGALGVALTAAAADDIFGAEALESATASGQLIRVRVMAPGWRSV